MDPHVPGTAGKPDADRSSWPGWRGRAREWELIAGLLQGAGAGRGGVLLVEGRSGMGKSRLLGVAAAAAARAGFEIAQGAADELTQLMPLAPLMSALGESTRTLPGAEETAGSCVADQRLLLVERLRGALERRVARRPVLLTLDDMHWADPTTGLALRSMARDLASYPLIWMLSRTSGLSGEPRIDRLYEALERDGATRITLEALDERAVAEVAADILAAAPESDVLALLALTEGNPFLLVELLGKFKSEGVFELADGQARLASAQLPQVRAVTRRRLEELSARTRRLLQVAGVLGHSFSVEDLAEMLGEPTSALLPMLEEATAAGIVAPASDELAFRHDLLWQAVTETLPAPMRRALHHEAGEMLLKRGGSAVPAAAHLIHSARPGDADALLGLDRAAREVLQSSPQTAADLALRALELGEPTDPGFDRTATAVYALTATGRLPEATELARAALSRAPPDQAPPHLRSTLAYILLLSGRPADAVSEAESVLTQQNISDEVRRGAEWTVFWGLICLYDFEKGLRRAEAVLADRERHDDTALVGALLLLGRFAMLDGRFADSCRLLHEALQITRRGTVQCIQRPYPGLLLSQTYKAMGRFEASDIALQAVAEEIEALGLTALAAQLSVVRGCLRLAADRLDDAAAEVKAGLAVADELGIHGFSLEGLCVLAVIAVRRGDINAAIQYIEQYQAGQATPGMMYREPWDRWAMAVVAEAQGDRERAMEMLHAVLTDMKERRWTLLTAPSAAWMTRLALATGDRPHAQKIVDTAEYLARNNPDCPIFAATAAHARGVLHKDTAALTWVAANHPQPWVRASAAEDVGVVLAAAPGDPARETAVKSLDQALDGYQRIGALRDAARVRARLRKLGVRHRHWAQSQRPTSGWPSLTDTERAVAALIAQGLTNRQAAARMFLSPHTVSTHLRQVFSKLGIASRVELARLAAEQDPDL